MTEQPRSLEDARALPEATNDTMYWAPKDADIDIFLDTDNRLMKVVMTPEKQFMKTNLEA